MKKSALDMRLIAARASVRVSANDYTALELKGIAGAAKAAGKTVCIADAKELSTLQVKNVARYGCVTFDFT